MLPHSDTLSFDEIILADYTPANLEAQKKWLNKDKDAADWTQFFKYFSKLDEYLNGNNKWFYGA
jgi:hypothetical protein